MTGLLHMMSAGGADTCIPGCLLWLDGSDPATITDSGTMQWADKSALANHATQSVAANKPIFSSVNKEFTVDATNDVMSFPDIIVNQSICSMFFVYNRTGGSNDIIVGSIGGTGYVMDQGANFLFNGNVLVKIASTSGARKLVSFISGPSGLKLYVNGVADATAAALGSGNLTFNLLWEYINTNNKFDGKFSAILIYNRPVSDAERILIETNLNSTFSIY